MERNQTNLNNVSNKRFTLGAASEKLELDRSKKQLDKNYGMPREGFEMFAAKCDPKFRGTEQKRKWMSNKTFCNTQRGLK